MIFLYYVMKCVNIWKICISNINNQDMMLQSHAWVKDTLKVQTRAMDFKCNGIRKVH